MTLRRARSDGETSSRGTQFTPIATTRGCVAQSLATLASVVPSLMCSPSRSVKENHASTLNSSTSANSAFVSETEGNVSHASRSTPASTSAAIRGLWNSMNSIRLRV
ncbi:hypothetical protein AHiyo8_32530 [Arthrobacter sp. Hiyo8]|nr:hypothetical protein AHiyo8_32530 [Arthrobacter sp. Hiyo8]